MRKPLRNQTIEVVASLPMVVNDDDVWPDDTVCLLKRAIDGERRWLVVVVVVVVTNVDEKFDDDDAFAMWKFLEQHPANELWFEVNARRMMIMMTIVNK
jgi:hypothetical protein